MTIVPLDELRCEHYLNLDLEDRPGALAAVAGIFAAHDVSIRAMEQLDTEELDLAEAARVLFLTHTAREADVHAAVEDLRAHDDVRAVNATLRVLPG